MQTDFLYKQDFTAFFLCCVPLSENALGGDCLPHPPPPSFDYRIMFRFREPKGSINRENKKKSKNSKNSKNLRIMLKFFSAALHSSQTNKQKWSVFFSVGGVLQESYLIR